MSVLQANQSNFEKEVLQSQLPVLVDFYTTWCGPCRQLSPIIEEISKNTKGFKVAKINIEEEAELAARYHIMSVPTLIVFKDGREANKVVGVVTKEQIMNMLV